MICHHVTTTGQAFNPEQFIKQISKRWEGAERAIDIMVSLGLLDQYNALRRAGRELIPNKEVMHALLVKLGYSPLREAPLSRTSDANLTGMILNFEE